MTSFPKTVRLTYRDGSTVEAVLNDLSAVDKAKDIASVEVLPDSSFFSVSRPNSATKAS